MIDDVGQAEEVVSYSSAGDLRQNSKEAIQRRKIQPLFASVVLSNQRTTIDSACQLKLPPQTCPV